MHPIVSVYTHVGVCVFVFCQGISVVLLTHTTHTAILALERYRCMWSSIVYRLLFQRLEQFIISCKHYIVVKSDLLKSTYPTIYNDHGLFVTWKMGRLIYTTKYTTDKMILLR
jgi:hypothetical protein